MLEINELYNQLVEDDEVPSCQIYFPNDDLLKRELGLVSRDLIKERYFNRVDGAWRFKERKVETEFYKIELLGEEYLAFKFPKLFEKVFIGKYEVREGDDYSSFRIVDIGFFDVGEPFHKEKFFIQVNSPSYYNAYGNNQYFLETVWEKWEKEKAFKIGARKIYLENEVERLQKELEKERALHIETEQKLTSKIVETNQKLTSKIVETNQKLQSEIAENRRIREDSKRELQDVQRLLNQAIETRNFEQLEREKRRLQELEKSIKEQERAELEKLKRVEEELKEAQSREISELREREKDIKKVDTPKVQSKTESVKRVEVGTNSYIWSGKNFKDFGIKKVENYPTFESLKQAVFKQKRDAELKKAGVFKEKPSLPTFQKRFTFREFIPPTKEVIQKPKPLPPLAPKGEFEKSSDYELRKAKYETQKRELELDYQKRVKLAEAKYESDMKLAKARYKEEKEIAEEKFEQERLAFKREREEKKREYFETRKRVVAEVENWLIQNRSEILNLYLGEQSVEMSYNADREEFDVNVRNKVKNIDFLSVNFKMVVPIDLAPKFKAEVKNFRFEFQEESTKVQDGFEKIKVGTEKVKTGWFSYEEKPIYKNEPKYKTVKTLVLKSISTIFQNKEFIGVGFKKIGLEEIEREKIIKEISKWSDRFNLGLPTSWEELQKLEKITASYKRITYIPASIGNLTNLQELNLKSNQLKELPASIGNLTNLQELNLGRNKLEELSASIGNLINLQYLSLCCNQLEELPASIENLSKLQKLYLGGNQLEKLPASIGNLTNLKELHLEKNQLKELPDLIGNLTNLQKLNLQGNNISSDEEARIRKLLPNTSISIYFLLNSLYR